MLELIFAVLGSSTVSSVVTWFVTKRERDSDFTSKLQESINILIGNYTETLNKLVQVQKQNGELIIQLEGMKTTLEQLKQENVSLRETVSELLDKNKKLVEGQKAMSGQLCKLTAENKKLNGLMEFNNNKQQRHE